MRRTLFVALGAGIVAAVAAPAQDARLVTDFTKDMPAGLDNAVLSLRFEGIRPIGQAAGDVVVQLQRRQGAWAAAGHGATADYNERSTNSVEVRRCEATGAKISGRLAVTIGPDGARRGRKHFPTPLDAFDISFTVTVDAAELLPYQPDREAFMPPWRKDVPDFGGQVARGTYEATWSWRGKDQQRSGQVLGALNAAPVPGRWGAQGNAVIGRAPGGGLKVLARLSARRIADGGAAWAVRCFAEPADWSAHDAVRLTVASEARRDDAAVGFGIRDAAGGSYTVETAALIRDGERQFVVGFEDFGGAWRRPDLTRIDRMWIGVSSRHGAGDVTFSVRRIELVRRADAPAPAGRCVTVDVRPDVAVSFNGADTIPKGLFGFHGLNTGAPKAEEGRPDPLEYMRRLNPGYVRKIVHTGFGADATTDEQIAAVRRQRLAEAKEPDTWPYRRAKAGNFVDNLLWCHTQDLWARPGWMNAGLAKAAEGVRLFYRARAAEAYVPGDEHNLLRMFEVWNEPFMWGRHINMGRRDPAGDKAYTDPTQYGYIPGKLGSDAWSELFLAAVAGARSANKHVRLGGPSAPAFDSDDYGVFTNYVARIIDRCHDKLDFLTEHHYGGEPRATAGAYEVATAYFDVKHNRRVPIYNTETNDLGGSAAARASYNIADILDLIRRCPDKAKGRAMHYFGGDWLGNEGEEHGYLLLNALRGRIVRAEASDPDVLAVAAAPRAGELVVVVLNYSPADRQVRMPLPEGFRLTGTRLLLADAPKGELQLRDVDGALVPKPAPGATVLRDVKAAAGKVLTVALPTRSAVRWTLARDGYAPTKTLRVEQHYVDVVLRRVGPEGVQAGKVCWRGPVGAAEAAALRVVTRDVQRGEAVAAVNGHPVKLPPSIGPSLVQEVAIEPAWLKPQTIVEFRCADAERSNGYTVCAASVNLVRSAAP